VAGPPAIVAEALNDYRIVEEGDGRDDDDEDTIERDPHAQNFVVIHNRVARDMRLKRASKGLLIEILSLPRGTRISIAKLAVIGQEGRDAVRTMLRDLEAYGYATRSTVRNKRGQYRTRYRFHETPVDGPPRSPVDNSALPDDSRPVDNSARESPVDNSALPDDSRPVDNSAREAPASENPRWSPPATMQETAGQNQRGFSDAENPSPKSKDKELKDKDQNHLAGAGASAHAREDAGSVLDDDFLEVIRKQVKFRHNLDITGGGARELLAAFRKRRGGQPAANPAGWIARCIENEPDIRSMLSPRAAAARPPRGTCGTCDPSSAMTLDENGYPDRPCPACRPEAYAHQRIAAVASGFRVPA